MTLQLTSNNKTLSGACAPGHRWYGDVYDKASWCKCASAFRFLLLSCEAPVFVLFLYGPAASGDGWMPGDRTTFACLLLSFDDSAPARCRYEKYPECNMTDDLLEHGPVFPALLNVPRTLERSPYS